MVRLVHKACYAYDALQRQEERKSFMFFTRQRLEKLGVDNLDSRIHFLKPFVFIDYVKLKMEVICVLSNSGTIAEEASSPNLPAVTIRNAHERPEGMGEGILVMSGVKAARVLDAVSIVIQQHNNKVERQFRTVPDYEEGLVSKKVLRVVLSYGDLVNGVAWSK